MSRADESEGDFRARLHEATRAARDAVADKLKVKYAPKVAALQERIRRAEQARERESEQVTQQGLQAAISVGATLIGALLGRKAATASTLGRATTAARGAGRVLKERQDATRAQESLEALQAQLAALDGAVQGRSRQGGGRGRPAHRAARDGEPVAHQAEHRGEAGGARLGPRLA